MIDIVGTNDGPGKFLGKVVFLIGDFSRDPDPDGVRAELVFDLVEFNGGMVNGFTHLKTEPGVSYMICADDTKILLDVGFNKLKEHPSPLLHNILKVG